MKLHQHVAVSAAISSVVFVVSRSVPMTAASFSVGVLLDLDHTLDYLREYGFQPDPKWFFHTFHNTLYRRVMLLLHGWEWLAVLGVTAILTHGNPLVIGAIIGITQHLILDQFSNGVSRWGYFFSYRAMKKFVTAEIFPGKGLSEK